MSEKKVMRGWVHAAAIFLGVAAPVALTIGTLRTGADYEMAISPKQVVDNIEKIVYTQSPHDTIQQYVSEDLMVNGKKVPQGEESLQLYETITRHGLTKAHMPQQHGKRVLVAGNLIIVYTKLDGLAENQDWKVDMFKVYGGKVTDYWTATPTALDNKQS